MTLNKSVTKLYQKNIPLRDTFWIFFYLANGRGDEFIDLFLPVPNLIIYPKSKNGVFIAYAIKGFFGTKKNKQFLQDIIKRFEKTFLTLSHIAYVERITHPPILDDDTDYNLQLDVIYSLKDFSTILKSLDYQVSKKEEKIENLKIAKALGERKITDDALFDYMRFIAYDFVNNNGKEALTKEYLEKIGEIGNEVLGKTKETSTIRAKAKAIYNWIIENYNVKGVSNGVSNWNYVRKTKDDKELKMTRQEIALKNAKERANQAKEKVYKAIQKLKKQDKKITILRVAELASVNKNTASKYIKQAKEEGII